MKVPKIVSDGWEMLHVGLVSIYYKLVKQLHFSCVHIFMETWGLPLGPVRVVRSQ